MAPPWLKPVEICSPGELEVFRGPVLQAIGEIAQRSGRRYRPEQVFDYLHDRLIGTRDFGLFGAIDTRLSGEASVCGIITIQVCVQMLGERVAFISMGWIRKGYRGEPFEYAVPTMVEWARVRGCDRLITQTERHLKGYGRWVGRMGFVQKMTMFEREI